jgi:hypothetical protein
LRTGIAGIVCLMPTIGAPLLGYTRARVYWGPH